MTMLHVSMTVCIISFVFMFVSVGHLVWRTIREAKREAEDPPVTRTEIQSMIDEAISRALSAKK